MVDHSDTTEYSNLTGRGPLFPKRLPVNFERRPAGPRAAELVYWWWIVQWDLPVGENSAQEVLAFPLSSLVFENTVVRFWGPTTKRSVKVLSGKGWAVGGLLKPAAVPVFTDDPGRFKDSSAPVDLVDCHSIIQQCVPDFSSALVSNALSAVEMWIAKRVGPISAQAQLVNRLADLAIADAEVKTVPDLARVLGVSERTVHRLTTKYVGLSPYSMIRRRRLQEAVEWARENPGESLAQVAAQFGFVDQAHLTREAHSVLGFSPQHYRDRLVCKDNGPSSHLPVE